MSDPTIAGLARGLDRAYHGPSWHGPSLAGSLRGISADAASWRPQPERHNIWEYAVHAAYWKYRVFRLLTDLPPRKFELPGSDFFRRPAPDGSDADAAWKDDQALLATWHDRLRGAVGSFDPGRLQDEPGKSDHTFEGLIQGAAAHDVYHAGQIRLLWRMQGR